MICLEEKGKHTSKPMTLKRSGVSWFLCWFLLCGLVRISKASGILVEGAVNLSIKKWRCGSSWSTKVLSEGEGQGQKKYFCHSLQHLHFKVFSFLFWPQQFTYTQELSLFWPKAFVSKKRQVHKLISFTCPSASPNPHPTSTFWSWGHLHCGK